LTRQEVAPLRDVALVVLGIYGSVVLSLGAAAHETGQRPTWPYAAVGTATVLLAILALGAR
jgi:hypothetical protein